MQYRTLGKTKEKVSVLGLGGFHIGKTRSENEGIRIIHAAIDAGITFLDNSWDYNEGRSEERMGKALKNGYRKKVFLMTKIDARTAAAAASQLEESLRRLQTDCVDLLQFHEIIRIGDPERIFGQGGALETALKAKKAGKIRYIGFTGHKDPLIHLHMLAVAEQHGFQFDAVQMPLNLLDAHFRSFERQVLPKLVTEGAGVLGMKPFGDGSLLESGSGISPADCLHYALNLPTSVVITGVDSMEVLRQDLDALESFRPLQPSEIESLMAKTSAAADSGRFELYKMSSEHDSTTLNPQWLG